MSELALLERATHSSDVSFDNLDTVSLASKGPKITAALRKLLEPHKAALLAVERAGQKLTEEAVLKAADDGTLAMFRASRKNIKAIQLVSAKLAYSHMTKELKLLGITEIPKMPKLESKYINKLNFDLRKSLKDPKLDGTQKAQRSGLAAVAAANRSYTEVQLAMYRALEDSGEVKVQKVWHANFSAPTPPCKICVALDGTAVDLDAEFPYGDGPKPYSGKLDGPPRHISCRCRLSLAFITKPKKVAR